MSAAQVPRRWSMIHQIRGSGVLGRSRGRVATGREACEEGRWKCCGFSDPPGKGGCIHSAHESLSGAPGGRQMEGKRSFPIIKEQFLPLLESRSMNLSLRGRIRARLTVFGPERAPDLSPCPTPHESSIVLGWRVLRRGPAGFAERLDSWRRSAHTDNPDPMTASAPRSSPSMTAKRFAESSPLSLRRSAARSASRPTARKSWPWRPSRSPTSSSLITIRR